MAEYIGCRNCGSPNCKGCNIYTLATMLNNGKFDCLMDGKHSVNPWANVVEVNAAELKYLINDTVAYIWRLEDKGMDKPEFGYDSRKALLEKLKQFEREHFPEVACCCGERKENK